MINQSAHSTAQQKNQVRDIDPNVLQGRASAPHVSSWVSASAGSGKTKVLTERILRLLLPDKNGDNQTLCHKILALTFTKAAASEMALRIQRKLKEWTICDDENLKEELTKLLERPANQKDMAAARQLFAEVTDSPSGLNIMTIHSFCQSVLSRFPLESGISPQFKALEETEAQALLKKAYTAIIQRAALENNTPLQHALNHLAEEMNEEQSDEVLNTLCSERYQVQKLLSQYFGADGLYTNLCQFFEINPAHNKDDYFHNFVSIDKNAEENLYNICAVLANGSKTDQQRGVTIQNWLESDHAKRIENYEAYKKEFLTEDKETKRLKSKKLYTKKIEEKNPEICALLDSEAQRILQFHEILISYKCATLTRDIFLISDHILKEYKSLKENMSALDFDDMILKTLDLLKGTSMQMSQSDMSPWVRFKLDQGIDHILVDEAQDTNPEQWEIIESLSYDFFDGEGTKDHERTIFVVGDEKQSIFSFQRASPEKFNTMRDFFKKKIEAAQKKFDPVDINISFRSVSCILELVDRVFDGADMKDGLGFNVLEHSAFRRGQPGTVELWPLLQSQEKEAINYWDPPIHIQESRSSATLLAQHIADTIKNWLDTKEILESHNRPIEEGDIMILMRSRNQFVAQLVKALKLKNIPVSGVDRMALTDEIAVQDIMAALQFSLLPDDDLTLACLLKSPFIGFNEEELFNIAFDRKGSLWQSLKAQSKYNNITQWLENLISKSGKATPYDFTNALLQTSCPHHDSGMQALISRLGYECVDPIDELLNMALDFEHQEMQSLQAFHQKLEKEKTIIKREMEEAGKAVRIMTVHGSKGLQAPIVILPDTIRNSASVMNEKLIWPDRSGSELPFFIPRSRDTPIKSVEAVQNIQKRSEDEYKRLLYVAMTRAENRLYIGGYAGLKKPLSKSWYYYVENGFSFLNGIEEIKSDFFDEPIRRYKTENSADKFDRVKEDQSDEKDVSFKAPGWLFKAMPEEPYPPRPLVPSRPSDLEPSVSSPLQKDHQDRFKRGNITHLLLQILPDLPKDQWEEKAKNYLKEPSHALSQSLQDSIVEETLRVLNHPDFAPIFSEGSMAEVPITGLLNNKTLISGQIDRLLITENDIYIIDYKTNRPPPKDVKNVPLIYKNQLKGYAQTLLKIYPDRKIHTALLWTEEARLMPVNVL